MRHIILISGKDSLAAALVQTARYPALPYEFLFTDVGAELPETYAWLAGVESRTGWRIVRVGRSLPERILGRRGFVPGPKSRYCTKECKIEPCEEYIGDGEATVYYGLRADEPRTGYVPLGKPNITPAYPLREAGIDLRGVYSILDAQGLTPPDFFWLRLYDAVAARLAGWPGWEAKLSRQERCVLFAGRSRANCYFCFFQRQYEFLWLMETHTDHFVYSAALEKEEYSFQPGFFLRDLLADPAKQRAVFDRRVNDVCRQITNKFQGLLFDEPGDNELSLISCGLMCGK